MKKNLLKKFTGTFLPFLVVIIAFAVCEIMMGSGSMTRSLKGQLVPICCWVVMAVSLNLVVGISGELSLGHAGFMSIGAFTGVVAAAWLNNMGVENLVIRLLLTVAASGIMAGLAGVLIGIPVLRLRGDYLAIVTLAFGEIIRNVLNCVYASLEGSALHFGFLDPNLPGDIVLNGPNGAKISSAIKVSTDSGFIAGFILVMFTLIVVLNLVHSRSGRAIMAIRDNRIAAESMGINVTKYKMMAFVTAAVLAGMAGAIYGLNFSTVTAAKFKFDQSINVLVFVVLGGIGNITGSVIAATVLTILPETLRAFSDYRMLVYAIVLILVMLITNNAALKSFINAFTGKLTSKTGAPKGGE